MKREDEQRLVQTVDTDSRIASTERRELPASVVKVVDELKKHYRKFEVPGLRARWWQLQGLCRWISWLSARFTSERRGAGRSVRLSSSEITFRLWQLEGKSAVGYRFRWCTDVWRWTNWLPYRVRQRTSFKRTWSGLHGDLTMSLGIYRPLSQHIGCPGSVMCSWHVLFSRRLDLHLCRLERWLKSSPVSTTAQLSLQCRTMYGLELPVDVVSQSALATTIEKNSHTLLDLSFQLDVHGSKLLALVIKRCKILQYFGVNFRGESRHKIGTVVLADIVSHLSKNLKLYISYDLDDVSFSSIVHNVKMRRQWHHDSHD